MVSSHGADSEVGRLATVMLHRPGNELKRLTPRNNDRLLFDGIPWVSRAQEEHDAFADAWASEECTSLLLTRTLNRAEVGEMVRRRMDPGDGRFVGLVVEHDGEVVGDSLLILQGTGLNEGEIGWTVLPQHAARGYATEAAREVLRLAFEDYGLRRVIANLDARNGRSAALCERLGMRREAHRLRDFWSKGTWTDSYEYALLREEWRGQA
jgi:RimJ/RimL family protein N-acetyltransferase